MSNDSNKALGLKVDELSSKFSRWSGIALGAGAIITFLFAVFVVPDINSINSNTSELSGLKEAVDGIKESNTLLRTSIDDAREDVKKLADRFNEAENTLVGLKKIPEEFVVAKVSLDETVKKLQDAEEALGTLPKAIKDAKVSTEKKISDLDTSVAGKISSLETSISELQESIKKQHGSLAEMLSQRGPVGRAATVVTRLRVNLSPDRVHKNETPDFNEARKWTTYSFPDALAGLKGKALKIGEFELVWNTPTRSTKLAHSLRVTTTSDRTLLVQFWADDSKTASALIKKGDLAVSLTVLH